jgi:hypothetical protein
MSEDHEVRIRTVESKLASHEAVCAERYQGIKDDLKDFKILIVTVGGALIAGMAKLLFLSH